MNAGFAIARSALTAASLQLDSSAHNLANTLTPGFRRQQAMLQDEPAGGVSARQMPRAQAGSDLKGDTINQMVALYAFKANLQVIKVQDRMLGSLLDTKT